MDGLVIGHVIAIAFWAGLVAVEVLFEAAGVSGKIDVRSAALLHRWEQAADQRGENDLRSGRAGVRAAALACAAAGSETGAADGRDVTSDERIRGHSSRRRQLDAIRAR